MARRLLGGVWRLRPQGDLTWAGLRMLLVLAALYTAYRGQLLLEGRLHISRGVVYFVVATAMLVVAAWRRPSAAKPAGETPQPATGPPAILGRWSLPRWLRAMPAYGWWGLLLAAVGLGFAFRLYLIGTRPFGVWFDEAQNGLVAQQILDGYHPVFVGGVTQLPALFFYVFAGALKVIGHGVLALRSVTTAAGILTIPFVYLLARELFDRRVAVIATFLFAVMRWHVNFSRFGMHGVFAPLFMAATFYFLARGLKGKGAWNFLAAGVMAGIGLQGYFSFLLVPFIVAFYLLHHTVFQRALRWRGLVLGVAAFAVVTAAVYSPVGVWAFNNTGQFNERTETLTITRDRSAGEVASAVWRMNRKHLLMFNSTGDGNGRHNLPGAPMLDTYTGLLFVLGVGYAVWRWRDSGHFLLLAWVGVTIQGGAWSVEFEAPQAYRTVGLTPAIAILAALPLGVLWRLATERTGAATGGPESPSTRLGFYGLGLAATLVTLFSLAQAGRLNFETYFHKQLRDNAVWASFSTDSTFVGRELARLGDDYSVYYSAVYAGQPTVRFLAPDAPPATPLDMVRDLPLDVPGPVVLLMDYTQRPTFELLKSYYPGGTYVEFGPPSGGGAIVLEAIISAEELASVRGLTYLYRGGELSEDGRVPAIDLDWDTAPPLPPPFRADWSGILKVSEYGVYSLEVRAPGPVELRLDGEVVAAGVDDVRSERLSLAQGLHDVSLRVEVRRAGPVQLLWRGGGAPPTPVPPEHLYSSPVRRRGLEGSYYREAGGRRLAFVRNDPFPGGYFHVLPVEVPFTVLWRGQIHIPETGSYRFYVQAVDEGSLTIDGNLVVTTPGPNEVAEAAVELAEGPHDIEILFQQRGGSPAYINVQWAGQEGGPRPISSAVLTPP